ncbi:MAG TPA: S8 family peptidase [Blastocatellia bacterium]|nr:S8 family peptidase [Blastocatellia bacterium]HMV85478.1 S8 family peptidase [Blastocatellia bacterium]HMZ20894.1 S8 family peptidase [Blastocatellia bacterium]HNG34556.1 S8 family peptidase [Blastocatellia bacterium]
MHGEMLRDQLDELKKKGSAQQPAAQVVEKGFYIEFEGEPGHDLKVESLKDKKAGIKLVAVTEIAGDKNTPKMTRATVFVPEGKISHFIKKVEDYLDPAKETKKHQKPKNQELIESISNIRLATLRSLWTETDVFPSPDELLWWEIWLRTDGTPEENLQIVQIVREQAAQAGLTVSESELAFPDTTVLLVRATAAQLTQSVYLLNTLAEVRRAKETAEFFINLDYRGELEWVNDANQRIVPASAHAPAVCLLDTGVNREHPLLQHSLHAKDMDAYNQGWGVSDHHGHGTEMAGMSLFGDLTELLLSAEPVPLKHRLESVKLVPPTGENDPQLYGAITTECMARAEVLAPERPRTYALMTSAKADRDRGRPSSWSAALDQYVSGAQDEEQQRRLIVIAAGNADENAPGDYPDKNLTDEIHDPGQAWNALTVGACTEKVNIDTTASIGWKPLAPNGGLCPSSTTSRTWASNWPFKPDVVFEGGNLASHPDESALWKLESLRLLTTCHNWQKHLLTLTGDTSAATALAARMCAQIMAEYPDFWPETVRGLLVHSAQWTSAMLPFDLKTATQQRIQDVLRVYGYGVPRLANALHDTRNSLTLIAQDEIQPFHLIDNEVKTNEMKLHELPWPRTELQSLGETSVEMRVTLSSFIEPKPQRNETNAKHPASYQSKNMTAEHAIP